MKILIEHRWDPGTIKFTKPLEETCKKLGHQTFPWRGPLSGKTPHPKAIGNQDLAIVWNGIHSSYKKAMETIKKKGMKTLVMELGWLPQRQTFQIDPTGFNTRASWAKEPLTSEKKTKLEITDGHILVLLQMNSDTQITQNSRWFKSMEDFVSHVIRCTKRKLLIRKHPAAKMSDNLKNIVSKCPRASFDNSDRASLQDVVKEASACALINSSAGIQVLKMKKPILSFGNSIYRKDGAVIELDNDKKKTTKTLSDLSKLEVYEERIDEILKRIISKQWVIDDEFPDRLDKLIKSL